mmetsp:Transcript_10643/g.33648  ORF Transcript_10643/g.33648 Transcript_10643/m.33648 type:complete len:238 (-) Transcript_10643:788-1501(-)
MRMDEDVVGPDVRTDGYAQVLHERFGREDNAVVLLASTPGDDLAGGRFRQAEAHAHDGPPGPEANRGEAREERAESNRQLADGGHRDSEHVCPCLSQPLEGVGRRARPQHDHSGLEHAEQRHDILPELHHFQAVTSDDRDRAIRSNVEDEDTEHQAREEGVIPHGPDLRHDIGHLHGLQRLLRVRAAGTCTATAALESVRPAGLWGVVDEEGAAGGGRTTAHCLLHDDCGDHHGHAS